jgi:hypothetical protein
MVKVQGPKRFWTPAWTHHQDIVDFTSFSLIRQFLRWENFMVPSQSRRIRIGRNCARHTRALAGLTDRKGMLWWKHDACRRHDRCRLNQELRHVPLGSSAIAYANRLSEGRQLKALQNGSTQCPPGKNARTGFLGPPRGLLAGDHRSAPRSRSPVDPRPPAWSTGSHGRAR